MSFGLDIGRVILAMFVGYIVALAGSQGKRDGYYDNTGSHPLCDGWRCFVGLGAQGARLVSVDPAMALRQFNRDRHWWGNRPKC